MKLNTYQKLTRSEKPLEIKEKIQKATHDCIKVNLNFP